MTETTTRFSKIQSKLSVMAILGLLLGMFAPLAPAGTAYAAQVTAVKLTGGTGTYTAPNGTIYAKSGGLLTLNVTTDADTKCVELTGDATAQQLSDTAKTSWSFPLTAGSGAGTQTLNITATAFRQSNPHGKCVANQNETLGTQAVSYVLDNAGPQVTAVVSPAPNAAGWNNSDVKVTWTATDTGSGVDSGPTPATHSVTSDTAGTTYEATATDKLGNKGSGSVTVKRDAAAPIITGSKSPAPNNNGWNNSDVTVSFTCSDATSGVNSCTPSTTVSTEGRGQQVTGTALDNAGNSTSTSINNINIDKKAPTLSGAPTSDMPVSGTSPDGTKWYNGDVSIRWTPADDRSGIDPATIPADSLITGEGRGLVATASVRDNAGNSSGTVNSQAVNIDRMRPVTGVDPASLPMDWTNTNVTIKLNASDNLSDVKATYYTINGGAQQTYDPAAGIALSATGTYTLNFWSVDYAGVVEDKTAQGHTATIKLDKAAPNISHSLSPAPNGAGWNRADVKVTFSCADADSGIKSCTAPQTVTAEGIGIEVNGTATDNAGNTQTDKATVNLDKTAPGITGSKSPAANAAGWHNTNVTVSFTCEDGTSGIKACSAPATLSQDGANQSATGSAADRADNTSSATAGNINIDKTAPSLSGKVTTSPNGSGWYRGDVTVNWTCSDATSGLAGACPTDSTITGEGNNLGATASVSDKAGNSASATVSGIQIDRTAPSTSVSLPQAPASGWYVDPIQVTLTGVDGLSGVATTYYSVDGGDAKAYTGPFSFGQGGKHTITFWSTDRAGNVEDRTAPGHSIEIKFDNLPPSIKGSRSPDANGFGWNNGPVMVSFACSDAESAIKKNEDGSEACGPDKTLTDQGEGQSVKGTATDQAGNTASDTVGNINIDLTAPSLAGKATTAPNTAGWYNGNVTINWTGSDALSGIDPATQPKDSVIDGEGGDLGAGPVSISDKAGNSAKASVSGIQIDRTKPTITSQSSAKANADVWYNADVTVAFSCTDALSGVKSCTAAKTLAEGANQSVTGTAVDNADNEASATAGPFNIDKTAPTLTGKATTDPNGNGWYNDDVTINWTGNDALSGVAAQPANSVIDGEGDNLSASASVSDRAGNTASETVSGIKIDRKAPITSANAPTAWVNNSTTVKLAATDNLSGVAGTYYTINDGDQKAYNADGISFSAEGTYTLKFWSVDKAGNVEAANTATIKIDLTAPTIRHTQSPAKNDNGWNNTDVSVEFTCADADGTANSGIASCGPDQTVTAQAADQKVTGTAKDNAGNTATDTASVSVDKTKPTISGAATTKPNTAGWYKDDVTVHFNCDDPLSGVTSCEADKTLAENGENQSVTGTATDAAGNRDSATVSGISIDKTAPTLTGKATTAPNGNGWYKGDVTINWTANDALSGVATAPDDSVIKGQGDNLSASASVSDKAGNEGTGTVTGIKIDSSAPATRSNAPSGWQNADVTVKLTATDNLSGVDATYYSVNGGAQQTYDRTTGIVLSTDGTHTIEFWSVDGAGNKEDANTATVQIDKTAPTIKGAISSTPNAAGWYSGSVTVTFICNDGEGSGLATCSESVTVTSEGANQSVEGVVYDVAGNKATATVGGINIDTTAPSLSGAPTAKPNGNGWYNGDVTINWTAGDKLSGVAAQPANSVVTGEGNNLGATASVSDKAGNRTEASVSGIQIDRTKPKTTVTLPGTDGANGWYVTNPAVSLSVSDNLSGVDKTFYSVDGGAAQEYTKPVVIENGTHTFTYWSVDRAGNAEDRAAELTFKVDTTKPGVTINGVADGAVYTLGNVPTPSCTSTATGPSGVGTCTGTLDTSGAKASGVGTYVYTATATNGAGQTTTRKATYRVIYRFTGFLQPINDTAHTTDQNYSIFKAGSTVPAKFQLKDASGKVIQASTAPEWLTPRQGVGTAMPVDETAYTATATTGGLYKWDATAQQYIYNWSTKGLTVGAFYRIYARFDDGQAYSVVIGLR